MKKWSLNFNIHCQVKFWTLTSCFRTFVIIYNTRRNKRKSFLHWKYCLILQKFMFSATSWVLKKWSYNFNINCQVTLWNLINCSLTFVMFYNTRRNWRNHFLHWKGCLFLQKFMFSATSWVLKKWSFNFNIKCQVTLWTLIGCFRKFVMYYNTRRSRPRFFHWKDCLFFKNLCFQQPLGSWRNGLITSTLIVKLPCGTPISCPLTFVLF